MFSCQIYFVVADDNVVLRFLYGRLYTCSSIQHSYVALFKRFTLFNVGKVWPNTTDAHVATVSGLLRFASISGRFDAITIQACVQSSRELSLTEVQISRTIDTDCFKNSALSSSQRLLIKARAGLLDSGISFQSGFIN